MNNLYYIFVVSLSVDIAHCIDLSFNNKKIKKQKKIASVVGVLLRPRFARNGLQIESCYHTFHL